MNEEQFFSMLFCCNLVSSVLLRHTTHTLYGVVAGRRTKNTWDSREGGALCSQDWNAGPKTRPRKKKLCLCARLVSLSTLVY